MTEGILQDCLLLPGIAAALKDEKFTLVDIGCSGGIDAVWHAYGNALRAFGFDPNVEECDRLMRQEKEPGVMYVPAFVGLRRDHPFAVKKIDKQHWGRNPWPRLAAYKTVQIRQKKIEQLAAEERPAKLVTINEWRQLQLADSERPVFLPDFFEEHKIVDIDFIKLDVDGADLEILHSLEDVLTDMKVLGLCMEVNFFGSDVDTDHTFHNTDRFLRSKGFELFNLIPRRYSSAALPSRYILPEPGQARFGRIYQGDALYVRDICDPYAAAFATCLSPEKVLKTASIFATFNLPDVAAETLVAFRKHIAHLYDVDAALNALAAQIQRGTGSDLGYKDYLAAFNCDSSLFYPPEPSDQATES
jgi:hypothetical protein